jgi:hypothetical protein
LKAGLGAQVTPLPGSVWISAQPIRIDRAAPLDTPLHFGPIVRTTVQALCPDRFQYRLRPPVILRICSEAVGPERATFYGAKVNSLGLFATAIKTVMPDRP